MRELAGELIQATLRDTHLNHGASQLAAQALAQALADAGYARVKVTVNGQTVHETSAGDEAAAPTTNSTASTSTAAAPLKEFIHGN